jgi:AraC-like DNA-binding protein
MQETNYGQRLANGFRLDAVPAIVARSLNKSEIGVGDCRSDNPSLGLSDSLECEDAYIIGLQLKDYGACENWEGGRCVSKTDVLAGETHLYDLKRDPRFLIDKPFHALFFHLPRSSFDAVAEESRAPPISELDYAPGVGRDDAVIRSLGTAMTAALERPERASRMFLDHVTLAVAVHVAQAYGGLRRAVAPMKGGLASWQQRRACEMMDAHLDGAVPLRQLAAECGLSVSHFSRAFRGSVGVAPHQWLLRRRVEMAKDLMRTTRLALSEVAIASGFADQSHFTKTFTRWIGVSPSTWRRHQAQAPDSR